MKCPHCGNQHTVKAGFKVTVHKGRRPRNQCMKCGKTFYRRGAK